MDDYDRIARLFPALLTIGPLALGISTWFLGGTFQIGNALGLGGFAGLAVLASAFVRDRGRRLQRTLYEKWGGKPTTLLIVDQLSDSPTTGDNWSRNLKRLFPEDVVNWSALPVNERQIVADRIASRLRERTNDRNVFPLLREENKSYGFRRNLWGMKVAGLPIAVASLFVAVWGFWTEAWDLEAGLRFVAGGIVVALALVVVVWAKFITPDWVRGQAFRYAHQLLASTETLVSRTQGA